MSIDLHIHTTASDGDTDPVTVVKMAAEAGLKVIALADHESTSGFHPAFEAGRNLGIKVIPAVELLTFYKEAEVHLLGYFPDPDNKYLQKELAKLRHQRSQCAKSTVEKLAEFGYEISWPDVRQLALPENPVSKGHIMQAIRNAGYIKDRNDAVNFLIKYLNCKGLAYICHDFSFEDGVELIKRAGGVPVLAHPGLIRDDEIVEELCTKGIAGIEVFYYYFGQ
ncbi:MAG: PHP domain-containing protein, partial [Eubacteriales bacterium]